MNEATVVNNTVRIAMLLLTCLAVLMVSATVRAQNPATSASVGASFFADHRAHGPGDVLTVLITETSSATETARTTTDKNDAFNALLNTPAKQRQWSVGMGGTFDGGGQISRTGKLLARISVTVYHIDERGDLQVQGDQDIDLNGEHQRIHLDGMVRSDDIAPDNTVPSWRVGNAKISLIGKGILGHSQKPGLLGRIMHFLHLD
jgi:flagellar L-ring protein precursor FlgH